MIAWVARSHILGCFISFKVLFVPYHGKVTVLRRRILIQERPLSQGSNLRVALDANASGFLKLLLKILIGSKNLLVMKNIYPLSYSSEYYKKYEQL